MSKTQHRTARAALMRDMAAKYVSLASATHDPEEQKRFLGYAAKYDELLKQSAREDALTAR